jgi:nucleoside-diphosphate-sugar epimerase
MNKLLITGANGAVGTNLCRHFLARGWEVYGLVRKTSDLHSLSDLNIRLVTGDLREMEAMPILPSVDFIIHSASIVSDVADDETCRENIYELAVNLVRKVREMPRPPRRIVHISTALTLGFDAMGISEAKPGRSARFMAYVRYKAKTEEFLLEEWRSRGLPVVILRPADVYGPHDRVSSAKMLHAIERGIPVIVGRGQHRLGYCFTANLCQAVELALLKEGIDGRAFTVTNGYSPTWKEFFTGLQKGLGRKQWIPVPAWALFIVAAIFGCVKKIRPRCEPLLTYYRVKRVTTDTTYDITDTIRDLGYRPDDRTDAQIAEIVAWYLKEKKDGFIK